MSKSAMYDFSHLPAAAGRLGLVVARPKVLAVACVLALAALGWLYVALLIAHMDGPLSALGPGMAMLDIVPRAIAALCRPTFGLAMPAGIWGVSGFVVVALMWAAMVLAMMLPSAGPMILAYAEIAETAARRNENIVSPFLIAAGYTVIWLGFAVVATLAQFVLSGVALLDAGMASADSLFSGAVLIAAGINQFSALKHACLTRCRQPFPFFFAHWQTTASGVFKLGLQQGLYCLGCCWAMMLVMFAVGVMNVIWMAALGIVMAMEKIAKGNHLSYAIGATLVALGGGFMLAGFVSHWPLHGI